MPLEAVAPEPVAVPAVKREAPRWLRAMFSFPVALSALLCLLMVLTVRGRFNDPDMWWHLKTGEIIWNTHHIPTVDTFSFTAAGHPWVLQEWLSQVTIYAAYHFGGYSGMMLWLCVLGSLLLIAGYALCWLYSGNAKVAFLGAMVIWLCSTIGLAIRPHMIGYVLFALELLILELGRSRNPRWFLALPVVFSLWINSHSSYMFGVAILGLVLLCSFVEVRWGLLISERWTKQARLFLAASFVLSLAGLFANPLGWSLVAYPADIVLHQSSILQGISEWQPADLGDPRGLAVLAITALVLLVPMIRRIEVQLVEILLVCITAQFALRHVRMEFLFGLIAAPILCRLLATAWENYEPARDRISPNLVVITAAVVIIGVAFPRLGDLKKQVESANPTKALAFMNEARLDGRLLNGYEYGGYLIWSQPGRKIFMDGRADVFGHAGVLTDYRNFVQLGSDPESILDKYRIEVCLLPRNEPVGRVLRLLPNWKQVYSDSMATVFVRRPVRLS